MIAICNIKPKPEYRRDAFEAGMRALGYDIVKDGGPKSKQDLLVIWNRQGGEEIQANAWEHLGGTVLVCENGYMGKDAAGIQFYAIAVHGHNGSGWFPVAGDDRFSAVAAPLAPWAGTDGHVLVCGQRGIGSKQMASPPGWEDRTALQIKRMGVKDVRIRRHPGRLPPATTLDADLEGASLCVIWSSASGVRALVRGVPVVFDAPHWICAGAAGKGLKWVHEPPRDDDTRLAALRRMAHAQWSVEEIGAGEPFKRILANLEHASW